MEKVVLYTIIVKINVTYAWFRCTPKVKIFSLLLHHINLWTHA
jgi:hypothetical protein